MDEPEIQSVDKTQVDVVLVNNDSQQSSVQEGNNDDVISVGVKNKAL